MEILLIIGCVVFLLSVVSNSILSHYTREYNKLLKEQNDALWEILKADNEIKKELFKTSGGGSDE